MTGPTTALPSITREEFGEFFAALMHTYTGAPNEASQGKAKALPLQRARRSARPHL